MAWPRAVATAAAFLTGTLLVAAGGFVVMAPSVTSSLFLVVGVTIAAAATWPGLIVARRDGNPVGAYLALVGLAVATTIARDTGAQVLAARPALAADLDWLVAVSAEGAWWVLACVALVMLHFPDGRLPSRRWRWVRGVLIASAAMTHAYGAVDVEPFRAPLEDLTRPFGAPPTWVSILSIVALLTLLASGLASAFSLVVRYRRGPAGQRRQIRWLAVGGLCVVAYPVLCLVEIALWGRPMWASVTVGVLGLVALPVTAGIALLRPDVYDVDRALAGTVAWGAVTTGLLALYALASVAAGLVLGRESALAAAVVTACAALALTPLRSRIQRRVDRRLYPLRRSAFEALGELQTEIAAGRRAPEQLEEVLRAALRDPGLRLGYRVGDRGGYEAVDGTAVEDSGGVPVELGRSQIGVLVATSPEITTELLRQVARRSAAAVEMVRLRAELASALREVESSRARLLQASYEERRRLERDLHDGAQQRLVSLGMALRLAQRHLDDGTVDVDELLDSSVAELGTAVAELRRLGHGIRPSSLDDGLPTAVARLARNVPIAVDLEVENAVLPDDIATTAYFVISEALANAVKHAGASRIGLQLQRVEGRVVVRVTDDGRGGARLSQESGIADRVAALGGSLRVASPPGRGTLVEAELPCAS